MFKRSKSKEIVLTKSPKQRCISMPKLKPIKKKEKEIICKTFYGDISKQIKKSINGETISSPSTKTRKNIENFMIMMKEFNSKK
jgi:hypothetical protein